MRGALTGHRKRLRRAGDIGEAQPVALDPGDPRLDLRDPVPPVDDRVAGIHRDQRLQHRAAIADIAQDRRVRLSPNHQAGEFEGRNLPFVLAAIAPLGHLAMARVDRLAALIVGDVRQVRHS